MNSRKVKWVLPASLSVLLCVASHRAEARNQGSAKKVYDSGQVAEAKDDVITAYEDYLQAFKKDPKDLRYKTAWQRTRLRQPRLMSPEGNSFASRATTARP